jgi:hypothetical protein
VVSRTPLNVSFTCTLPALLLITCILGFVFVTSVHACLLNETWAKQRWNAAWLFIVACFMTLSVIHTAQRRLEYDWQFGKDLEGSSHGRNTTTAFFWRNRVKSRENLIWNNLSPGGDSKWAPPEYKSKNGTAAPTCLVWLIVIDKFKIMFIIKGYSAINNSVQLQKLYSIELNRS